MTQYVTASFSNARQLTRTRPRVVMFVSKLMPTRSILSTCISTSGYEVVLVSWVTTSDGLALAQPVNGVTSWLPRAYVGLYLKGE